MPLLIQVPSHLVPSFPLVGNSSLPPVKEWKYLGLTFDSQLTLSPNIPKICRSAYFHLHRIGKIRRFLDAPTTLCLVHAFILSRIDYYSAVLAGLPSIQLDRMLKVIN